MHFFNTLLEAIDGTFQIHTVKNGINTAINSELTIIHERRLNPLPLLRGTFRFAI